MTNSFCHRFKSSRRIYFIAICCTVSFGIFYVNLIISNGQTAVKSFRNLGLSTTTRDNHLGLSTTRDNHLGLSTTRDNHLGLSTTRDNHLGLSTTRDNHLGLSTTRDNHLGLSTTTTTRDNHSSSSNNRSDDKDDRTEQDDKWIIVSLDPKVNVHLDLESFSKVTGWKKLIVVSNRSLLQHRDDLPSDVTILDDHQLSRSGFEFTSKIDVKSWTEIVRLAASVLYAIQNRANYIYIADDRFFIPPTSELKTNEDNLRLIYPYDSSCLTKCLLYNPLIHFGQPVEPYGWIGDHGNHDSAGRYYVLDKTYPGVQHFIVNNNIDAKVSADSRYGVDTVAPPVVLSPGVYSPFLFTNTLFSYETFWGFFTGRFTNTERTQVLSSYWMQTLTKYINADIMFDTIAPSKSYNIRKRKDDADVKKFGKYVKTLSSWKCKGKYLISCIKELSKYLVSVENFYHRQEDSSRLSLWIKDLLKAGYIFPKIVRRNFVEIINKTSSNVLLFHPSEIRFKSESSSPLANITRLISSLQKVCGDSLRKYDFKNKLNATFKPMFPKVLMIITFNLKHVRVLPLLEMIYKVQFPNVIVCANGDDYRELADGLRYSLYSTDNYTFAKVTNSPECISRVLKLGYKVSGMIHIHDDIVFNYWNVIKWNWTKIWSLPTSQTLDLFSPNTFVRHPNLWWHPADSFYGLTEVLNVLKSSTKSETTRYKCYKNLLKLHGGATYKYHYALCDIFYIPARLASSFSEIIAEFANRDVWLEIAIPTTLDCIEQSSEHIKVKPIQIPNANKQAWNGHKRYVEYLSQPYYHPFKLEPLLSNDLDRKSMFCEQVVKQAIKFW